MRIKYVAVIGILSFVGGLVLPGRVSASTLTVANNSLSGTNTYVYAFAKVSSTNKDTKSDSSAAGASLAVDTTLPAAPPPGKNADAQSNVTVSAGSTTLSVFTTAMGTGARAEGLAQVGTTYTASPAPFTLDIGSLFLQDVFQGETEVRFVFRLDELPARTIEQSLFSQLEEAMFTDQEKMEGWTTGMSPKNFYFLEISFPAGADGIEDLSVINFFNPFFVAGIDLNELITQDDFLFFPGSGFFYNSAISPTTIVFIIDPDGFISPDSIGPQQTNHPLTMTVVSFSPTQVIPEPSTVVLVGVGLLSLGWAAWKRRRR